MTRIMRSLQFDRRAALPRRSAGFWFPRIDPSLPIYTEILLWMADVSGQLTSELQIYRVAEDSRVHLWCLVDEDIACGRSLPPACGIPLKTCEGPDGSNVWIPYNAQVVPAISDLNLSERRPSVSRLVWLPSDADNANQQRLICLEASHGVSWADLIAAPKASETVWLEPPEIPRRFPVIRQLQPAELPDLDELLADGNDWIGSESDQISKEMSDAPKNMVEAAKRWVLKKLDGTADPSSNKSDPSKQSNNDVDPAVSSTGGEVGAGNGSGGILSKIPKALAQRLAKRLQAERERQIENLLKMLKSDPDRRAVRFTLGGGDGFRGFAIPGSKLLDRLPEFSLGGIRGGGPVDQWSLQHEVQAKLRKSYHEQINRLVASGLYRRAAYVAAELLSDYLLAANTLEKGGFHSEAAEVYSKKLRRLLDAARCWNQSGQWEKAVKIFWEQGEIETAADSLRNAGQESDAVEAYEEAVVRYKTSGRVFDAVNVLDKKLQRRDQAIELLWEQWPSNPQAVAAGERAMVMLIDDGKHQQVLERLEWMPERAGAEGTLATAMVCRLVAKTSPDDEVRRRAADHCRVAAVRGIEMASSLETDQRMDLIASLEGGRGLLRRDARTYAEQARQQRAEKKRRQKTKAAEPNRNRAKLEMVRCFDLGLESVIYADAMHAIGFKDSRAIICRFDQGVGPTQVTPWDGVDLEMLDASFLHRAAWSGQHLMLRQRIANANRPPGAARPTVLIDLPDSRLGPLDDVVTSITGQIMGLRDLTLIAGRVVKQLPLGFEVTATWDLSEPLLVHDELPIVEGIPHVSLLCIDTEFYLITAGGIANLQNGIPDWLAPLDLPAKQVIGSYPRTRKRIVVRDEAGVKVYWLDGNCFQPTSVGSGSYDDVCLLRNGALILRRGLEIEWHHRSSGGYFRKAFERLPKETRPLSMVAISQTDFLIIDVSGQVMHWKCRS